MHVIDAFSGELAVAPEPGELFLVPEGFLAAVLAPVDVGLSAQDTGAFLAAGEFSGHEGAEVEAHPVVDVRRPADGLLGEGFPADEEIEGRLGLQGWRLTAFAVRA